MRGPPLGSVEGSVCVCGGGGSPEVRRRAWGCWLGPGGCGDSVVAAETPETATSTHLAISHASTSLPGLCCPPGPPLLTPVLSPQQGLSCCPGDVSRLAGAELPEGVEWS